MKLFIVLALVAAAAAQISNDYLPPHHAGFEDGGAGFGVGSYSAPAPVAAYSAPVASFETQEVAAAAPAHSFSEADGYRYRTQRRRVVKTARRHRRQVSSEYLPPVASYSAPAATYAAPAPVASYSAPAASYSAPAASYSAPAPVSYAAPAAAVESYDVGASAPAHSFSDVDGYRYKTQRRRVVKTARRHRRQVSSEYLPPVASYSAPAATYAAPAPAPVASYSAPAASYSAPAPVSYAAPAAAVESYDVGASAPAHSFSDADGYRYKTQRRRVVKTARRHRRQVSSEYLPPVASYSAPAATYAAPAPAPVASYSAPAASYSAPAPVSYAAPAAAVESYDVAASAPAHSFSDADGYRYKTQRRRVVKTARRHRRQVSSEYLPPVASYSAPVATYAAPAPAPVASYSAPAASYSAPAPVSYAAPAAAFESYDVGASAPAHSFSDADGYRYKTQRRRVVKTARRHRRDVSAEYLPPVASNSVSTYAAPAPVASYSAPAASYSAPAASYSAPAAAVESYDVAASAPAHSFSGTDGYRYKTQRRRVIRRQR